MSQQSTRQLLNFAAPRAAAPQPTVLVNVTPSRTSGITGPYATMPPQTVINNNYTVHGSLVTERQIANTTRQNMQQTNRRNGTNGP